MTVQKNATKRFMISNTALIANAKQAQTNARIIAMLLNKKKDFEAKVQDVVANAIVDIWREKGKQNGCAALLNDIITNSELACARDYAERIGIKLGNKGITSLTLPDTVKTESDLWKHIESIPFKVAKIKNDKPEAPKLSGDEATKWIVGQIKRLAHNSKNKCVSAKFANELAFIAEHYDEIQKFIATYKKENKN